MNPYTARPAEPPQAGWIAVAEALAFDGATLDYVAARVGLTVDQVVAGLQSWAPGLSIDEIVAGMRSLVEPAPVTAADLAEVA